MKPGWIAAISLGVICASVGTPIAVRNWSNIMDMGLSGEDRVKRAFNLAEPAVKGYCSAAGLSYPPKKILIRAFKDERELEVWGSNAVLGEYVKIQTYRVAGQSGKLGPKRKEGDLQVPEGVYHVDRFNSQSRFRLSLGLNYPNASDRVRSDPKKPGGDIFIHGDTRSIGCLAMTDEKIDEIYIMALQANRAGLSQIDVHIFPFRMNRANLAKHAADYPANREFWNELLPVYERFEATKSVPKVKVDAQGRYSLAK